MSKTTCESQPDAITGVPQLEEAVRCSFLSLCSHAGEDLRKASGPVPGRWHGGGRGSQSKERRDE